MSSGSRSRRPGSVPDRRLSGVSRRTTDHLELRRTANDKFRADFVTSSATDRRAVEIRTLSERDDSADDSTALRALKELENSLHRSSPDSLSPLISLGFRAAELRRRARSSVCWSSSTRLGRRATSRQLVADGLGRLCRRCRPVVFSGSATIWATERARANRLLVRKTGRRSDATANFRILPTTHNYVSRHRL